MRRRFERIYDVVESVEEYRYGGYHPVHLNDIFNHRYKIVGKLAHGQYSTVWLALDQSAQRHVALKIVKADQSQTNNELEILQHLSRSSLSHPGRKYVIELLDHFQHNGPNGTHLCLVLPVMLSDGSEMTVRGQPRDAGYIKKLSARLILGLDFLHTSNVIHCDLQPANILFSVAEPSDFEIQLQNPEFCPVKWLEGTVPDESAPKYLLPSQRFRGALDKMKISSLVVKIGDLGGAISQNVRVREQPITPRGLRAPELIRGDIWDASIDIWSLGCLIFEFATNEPLFTINTFGITVEDVDKEHKSLIGDIIGSGSRDCGIFLNYLKQRLPSNFGEEDVQSFGAFLRSMLQTNPRHRIPTAQLLRHSWLVEGRGCDAFSSEVSSAPNLS
ncbi:hypothetical protein ABEF93_005655 [Exophiala dermatitidis]